MILDHIDLRVPNLSAVRPFSVCCCNSAFSCSSPFAPLPHVRDFRVFGVFRGPFSAFSVPPVPLMRDGWLIIRFGKRRT
jgi:hypothetical protein